MSAIRSALFGRKSPWEFIAAGAIGTGTNPTAAVPAGVQAGDFLFLVITATTIVDPAGWNKIFSGIYWKIATSSESNVLATAGSDAVTVMLCYRGIDKVNTFDVSSGIGSGTGTTHTSPAFTTNYPGNLIIYIYSHNLGVTTWSSAPSGTNTRVQSNGTAALKGLLITDERQEYAGLSVDRAATISTSRTYICGSDSFREEL